MGDLPALITTIIAAVLTLCVLSRIIGDNPAFRIAQYLFVGVSLGYGFVVLYFQVLRPAFTNILAGAGDGNWIRVVFLAVPFGLGLLFLPRMIGRQAGSWMANFPLGLIFGVGVALSLVGVLAGTLLPQMRATIAPQSDAPLQIAGAVLLALGVIVTLSYFYFTVPTHTTGGRIVAGMARVGRWLLMVAFGFFFASALITYLTALSERIDFLLGRG